MYGTVARMTLKAGAEQQLADQLRGFEGEQVPGFIRTTIYRLEGDANEYLMAVVFDSKEAYVANAESPGQSARYQEMRALMEADPVWSDGAVIHQTS